MCIRKQCGEQHVRLDWGFLKTLSDFYHGYVMTDFENQEAVRESDPGVDWGLRKMLSKRQTQKHFKELLEVCFALPTGKPLVVLRIPRQHKCPIVTRKELGDSTKTFIRPSEVWTKPG